MWRNWLLLPRSFPRCLPRVSLWGEQTCGRMERAVVRCVPCEPKLTISFTLDGSRRQLLRDQTEGVGKALQRIASGVVKSQSKSKKSKKGPASGQPAEPAEPAVVLRYNGERVASDATNVDAWRDGAVLHVGEMKYRVERNPPTLVAAELPASLLAGFPVCPKLEIEFGELRDCVYRWFKEGPDRSWTEAGSDRVYKPSNSDVGLKIKLKVTPGDGSREGVARELVSAGAVEAGPGGCTFDNRHAYTCKVTDESTLRVVTYNILADVYAQTEVARTVLYPYCAPYALDLDYRQNLIKKELSGYNADIICLQEVDKNVFADSLSPALDAFGMDGVFRIKDKQHEGLATYFRRSKLKLLSQHDVVFSEALTSDPLHSELLQKVSSNASLLEKVLKRSTTLQVTVLQALTDPTKQLCVANTHLYWHPKGGHIRLIHMDMALRHLHRLISTERPGASLLFFGDFNSSPSCGAFQLADQGSISHTHPDWTRTEVEEHCPMDLVSPFQLQSASGEPAYTNYVGGFHGCLDYIFLEPRALKVEQVIPMPSHQEVTTHQALPSVSHPSDHIALICDLKWK